MADDNVQKRLIRQWRNTGRVLTEIRLAELAAMREEESRHVALDYFVEMQRLCSNCVNAPRLAGS